MVYMKVLYIKVQYFARKKMEKNQVIINLHYYFWS